MRCHGQLEARRAQRLEIDTHTATHHITSIHADIIHADVTHARTYDECDSLVVSPVTTAREAIRSFLMTPHDDPHDTS